MTHDHDDASELADIDLHVWRVPPPPSVDRPSLLVRALSPAVPASKPLRLRWIMAAIVVLNAVIATLLIVLARPHESRTTVTLPAGGGAVDARVRELLQKLDQQQRELERKLAEIEEMRTLINDLAEKNRQNEEDIRDLTVPKRDRRPPARVDRPGLDRPAPDPVLDRPPAERDAIDPGVDRSCDEVSCVLTNYEGQCCAKFGSRRGPAAKKPSTSGLPEALDRSAITSAIATVKPQVLACRDRSTATGMVKIKVRVAPSGGVTNVVVDTAPDAALGACVAAAIRRAVFAKTDNGGAFSYPFIF